MGWGDLARGLFICVYLVEGVTVNGIDRMACSGLLLLGVFLGTALTCRATPPNTAVLDGRPIEYDDNDFRGNDTTAPGFGSANVITNLYVTWDAEYLYVALQGFVDGNKLNVMLDVDPGNGTGATTTTNWINNPAGYIGFNGPGWAAAEGGTPFGLDYAFHSTPSGFNTIVRVLYDGEAAPEGGVNVIAVFDEQNFSTPRGTSSDIVLLHDPGPCRLKGMEVKMAWSDIYNSPRFGAIQPGEVVPRGATIQMWAGIHNDSNADAFSAPNTIPEQTSPNASYDEGLLITDTYIDVVIDGNNDGFPDLAVGEVNAPFITSVSGSEGITNVIVVFNKDIDPATANIAANYTVGGVPASSAMAIAANTVLLGTETPLPAAGSFLSVTASGVEDLFGNSRSTEACLFTAGGAIANPVSVTFVLEANSGFGPTASNFYLTGTSFPLDEGLPAPTNTPLTKLPTTSLWSTVVSFPAGTPSNLYYRFAGTIDGINTYEAIRLVGYEDTRRLLVLPNDGSSVVVTGHLGAAAAPLRSGGPGSAGYAALYTDPVRGAAGVRGRYTVLFQLNLGDRELPTNSKVLLQGSDPLRGFNHDGVFPDFAGDPLVGWTDGGVELFDDGTHGDLVAGDGIYSRLWSFTTDGFDPLINPASPHSLVDPGFAAGPYFGSWNTRRSPRSVIYKYYVKDMDLGVASGVFESPSQDLTLYLPDDPADLILPPFRWDNPVLPLRADIHPAEIVDFSIEGTQAKIVYTNIPAAADNVIEIAETPEGPWDGFGLRGDGASGVFTAMVQNVTDSHEFYRVVTPGYPGDFVWWTPASIPKEGATVRVYYTQSQRALDGQPQVLWFGRNPVANPEEALPMTFAGQGQWYIDLEIASNNNTHVEFEFTEPSFSIFDKNSGTGGNNYQAQVGGRASWAPDPVAPGGTLTISYDATGSSLENLDPLHVWLDFGGWEGGAWNGANHATQMTNVGSNLWEVSVPVPPTATRTANWVFKSGASPAQTGGTVQWDNNNTRDWHAFIRP